MGKLEKELHDLIVEYLAYCNEVYDYNYSPPLKLDLGRGEVYQTSQSISNIKCREEPTFLGFANWMAQVKMGTGGTQ